MIIIMCLYCSKDAYGTINQEIVHFLYNRALLGKKSHISPFKMRTFKPQTAQLLF